MSIQDKIKNVNEWSQNMELGLVLIAALSAMILIATGNFGWAASIIFGYIPLSILLKKRLRVWRTTRILEIYRYQFEPIFEVQQGEEDADNFERAEYHRLMLTESGNEIWERKLITVEEFYDRDPRFGYAESSEEQALRREDYMREFLNNWALNLTKDNAFFVKQWLNKQKIVAKTEAAEVAPIIPSVEVEKTGDFWERQFPLMTKLMRGNGRKEVSQA